MRDTATIGLYISRRSRPETSQSDRRVYIADLLARLVFAGTCRVTPERKAIGKE